MRREFTHRLKDAAPHVVIELASLLIDVRQTAYRFIAYKLIHHHPAALSHLNAWQLEQLAAASPAGARWIVSRFTSPAPFGAIGAFRIV